VLLPPRQVPPMNALFAVAGEGLPWIISGWQPINGIGVQIGLAGMAMYSYSQMLARNTELQRIRQELADLAVARERERMARDVHDILGHSLTVITVKAELAGKLLTAGAPARAATEIADVESLARPAHADVRATLSGLRSARGRDPGGRAQRGRRGPRSVARAVRVGGARRHDERDPALGGSQL
jgi:two-component system sensor histidine kinase DesK